MRTGVSAPESVELSILRPDNRLLIENHAESVVIRAAADNSSPRQKAFFIRYLAAEGYIPERYQWFADPESESYPGLRWLVDTSWKKDPGLDTRAVRQILRVILWAGLFWLGLMVYAFLHAPR